MKIESYKTIAAALSVELDEKINALIKQGFQPYGDPYYIAPQDTANEVGDIFLFNQAVVEFND